MSSTTWQDLATFALMGLALSYVIRRIMGLVGSKPTGGGCGSCSSCPSSQKNANLASSPQIVSIGSLPGRKSV